MVDFNDKIKYTQAHNSGKKIPLLYFGCHMFPGRLWSKRIFPFPKRRRRHIENTDLQDILPQAGRKAGRILGMTMHTAAEKIQTTRCHARHGTGDTRLDSAVETAAP